MAHDSSVQQADPIVSAGSTGSTGPAVPTVDDDLAGSDVIAQDLLVEEVSIDGMCGVY